MKSSVKRKFLISNAAVHGGPDDVETPTELYNELNEEFNFDFDPCPFKADFDSLKMPWGQCNFVNPPFSSIKKFLLKAVQEQALGNKSVFLIPFRPKNKYWQMTIFPYASEIRVLTHGVTFKSYKAPALAVIAIVVFKKQKKYKKNFVHQKKNYSYLKIKRNG